MAGAEMWRWFLGAALTIGAALFCAPAGTAQPVRPVLPTDNDALLRGDDPDFYMYTDRNFEGVRSRPWQGGQYGFVRNELRTPAGVVFTRFHEGMDIRPVHRDARGEPLDDVRAADAGRVMYVNTNARASAYGLYVVVEHVWQGSPYYTLYGHLSRVYVREGQQVARGERLARLGYTGVGIDRRRAHVHFEVNLLLSTRFGAWLQAGNARARNTHGLYHGLNLAGVDVARLYRALDTEGDVNIGEVVQREPVAWKALVPGGTIPELIVRYPWMAGGAVPSVPPSSWLVHVSASGLPLRFEAATQPVTRPILTYIAPPVRDDYRSTNKMLEKKGGAFLLTDKGLRHLDLLTTPAASIGTPGQVGDGNGEVGSDEGRIGW